LVLTEVVVEHDEGHTYIMHSYQLIMQREIIACLWWNIKLHKYVFALLAPAIRIQTTLLEYDTFPQKTIQYV